MTGDGLFVQGMVTNKMILRYLESIISYEMLDPARYQFIEASPAPGLLL